MTEQQESSNPVSPSPVKAKQIKSRSSRKLTFWRSFGYRLVSGMGFVVAELLWRSARIRIVGAANLVAAIETHAAVVPVCWHQHLLICARYIVRSRVKGLRAGFLISPSLDGEAPSLLAQLYGAQVIRGSGTYTGAQAVRALYKQIKAESISPLITPDGPRGPRFEFKGGALTVAQLCGLPVVPLAFAAKPVKVFRTWDKFVLPWPFARIVIAIGEPFVPPRKLTAAAASAMQQEMATRLHETYKQAAAALQS